MLRNLCVLLLIKTATARDECEMICSMIPGACSSKGSYCKNGHACMDLFWFTDMTVLCNSENVACRGKREVLCSQARSIVESGNSERVVSFVNMGSSTTAPTTATGDTSTTAPTTSRTTSTTPPTSPRTTSTTTPTTTRTTSTTTPATAMTTSTTASTNPRTTSPPSSVLPAGFIRASPVLIAALADAERRVLAPDAADRDDDGGEARSLLRSNSGQPGIVWYSGLESEIASAVSSRMRIIFDTTGVTEACMWVMDLLVARPVWFYLGKSTTQTLRGCTMVLVTESDSTDTSGPFVDGVVQMLSLLYSPVVERMVRSEFPVPVAPEFAFFRQTIATLTASADGIRGRIATAIQNATPDEWIESHDAQGRAFIQRLIDTNFRHPSVEYLMDFIDLMDRSVPLYVVRMILNRLPDFDRMERDHVINDQVIESSDWYSVASLFAERGRAMFAYHRWRYPAGEFFKNLYNQNRPSIDRMGVYLNCLSSDYVHDEDDDEDDHMRKIYSFLQQSGSRVSIAIYRCLTDAVVAESVNFSTESTTNEGIVSLLLYMYRMTSSVSAYLVSV